MHHGRPSQLSRETVTEFGVKRVYEGPPEMPDGSNPRVRSVWHKARGDFPSPARHGVPDPSTRAR